MKWTLAPIPSPWRAAITAALSGANRSSSRRTTYRCHAWEPSTASSGSSSRSAAADAWNPSEYAVAIALRAASSSCER